jgi:hypothetical protein
MGTVIGQEADTQITCTTFPFSPHGGFLCGNDALLFFTCSDNVVLLFLWFANLGRQRSHSLCLMAFNKRRDSAFDRSLANEPKLDRLSSDLLNNRISPEKFVRATSAHNQWNNVISLIGCRPKEVQVVHKTQASSGFFLPSLNSCHLFCIRTQVS